MKEYMILISDMTALFYEDIAKTTDKKTEDIISDTRYKVVEMIVREISCDEK